MSFVKCFLKIFCGGRGLALYLYHLNARVKAEVPQLTRGHRTRVDFLIAYVFPKDYEHCSHLSFTITIITHLRENVNCQFTQIFVPEFVQSAHDSKFASPRNVGGALKTKGNPIRVPTKRLPHLFRHLPTHKTH